MSDEKVLAGPAVGDFIPAPSIPDDEPPSMLPKQEEFFRPPTRFGSVPVEEKPLGYDSRAGYKKLFPPLLLPTQVVDRVSFGHPEFEPNRLFWGDNLHVMRSLPPKTIDLIYIDPPFFSGRNYNVIFGDKNELRSFSDIWEGGMPGYLIWLNARLLEMKRLLRDSGSIFVHLDWHAAHYVKVEMDKIFGHACFQNELIWHYETGGASKQRFSRKHDNILWYSRSPKDWTFNGSEIMVPRTEKAMARARNPRGARISADDKHKNPNDVLLIQQMNPMAKERIGYPTQKPEELLATLIRAASNEGEVVADFFAGGGTTASTAQQLGRKWICCDQSRVAVAITADRLAKGAEQLTLSHTAPTIPDFTVEHWGVYERERLSNTPLDGFREFVLRAFGATPSGTHTGVHGFKGSVPIWVGAPQQKVAVKAADVLAFANAIKETPHYQQDNLRDGVMLAWAFRDDARIAAERLREMEAVDLNFVRLEQIRIDSPRFREHIASLSTTHADYANFLTFVQPPRVEIGWKRVSARTFLFDASETVILNPGGVIINVQWDFGYEAGRFTSTQGFSFVRGAKGAPAHQAEYTFESSGRHKIAVKVQDDLGGEGMWTGVIEV